MTPRPILLQISNPRSKYPMKTFPTKSAAIKFFSREMPRNVAIARVNSMMRAKSIRILEFEMAM